MATHPRPQIRRINRHERPRRTNPPPKTPLNPTTLGGVCIHASHIMAQARWMKAVNEASVFSHLSAIRLKRLSLLSEARTPSVRESGEPLDEMALLVEVLVERIWSRPRRVGGYLRRCARILVDEDAQMIGVIRGVADHEADPGQPFEQATRSWTIAPLAGGHDDAKRIADPVDGGVDLGRQPAA